MRKRLQYSILPLLVLSLTGLKAQDQSAKMDSIRQYAHQEQDPLKRSESLLLYSQYLNSASTDEALEFTDSLIAVYRREEYVIGLARAQSMKAWFLAFQARYEESVRLGHQALKIQQQIKDSLGIAQTLNRIGVAYLYFRRFEDARRYLHRSLDQFIRQKDTARIDMILNNLGVVASEQNQPRQAIDYYQRSLKLRRKIGNQHWIAYSYNNIGEAYLKLDMLDSARRYLLLAVETFKEKTDHHKVPPLVSHSMGQLYRKQNHLSRAIEWTQKALDDAEEKNHTEIILPAKKALSEILYESGHYKEAYQMNLEYQRAGAEQDSVNNVARVAEIEAKYKNAEKEAEIAYLQTETLQAKNRTQQLWVLILGIVLISVLLVSGVIIIYQRRLQKQKLHQSELKAGLSEIRMMALRAQMNPHFIFNCINTTQNFVLNSEKEAAYDYLSRFASLLRMVLENSGKTFVPLEDELKQINLYIELEAIRFDGKFSYKIEVDPGLLEGVYEIPGMVIQPLVENAILHGLMNRNDDKGQLCISLRKEGEKIGCMITDNGVGRQKASEIKARKKMHYQSSAIPNIRERLRIMLGEEDRISLDIKDLTENGEATGTRVMLYFPYR